MEDKRKILSLKTKRLQTELDMATKNREKSDEDLMRFTIVYDENIRQLSQLNEQYLEDVKKDKSAIYNLNAVEGAWVVVQRIDNDEVWADVKSGLYQGYSIEGYFSEKAELNLQQDAEQELIEKIKQIILTNEN